MPSSQRLSSERVRDARALIDPVFLRSELLEGTALDGRLGLELLLKDETNNPIRSFKGRGTSLFVRRDLPPGRPVVTASAGNFGQGLAYNAGRRGHPVVVFASEFASPVKVAAMRKLGAAVLIRGRDFDAAKAEARAHAEKTGALLVEDGALTAIAEGAGTIAAEITDQTSALDAIFVPLGNGALATGIGCWFKAASPSTRVIAVAAEGAPCMKLSWEAGRAVSTPSAETIGDGIAVRLPVPFAVESMVGTVDEVMLVSDADMLAAMDMLSRDLGRVVEPAGAAGLAGVIRRREEFAGRRVATVACGANLTPEQMAAWLPSAARAAG
jgi:threonine dehydratase